MKPISTNLKTHLAQETTTLATCWKMTRRDGTIQGFTDHDHDISYDNVKYQSATGFTPSAIQNSSTLSVDNLDIEGMLNAQTISDADVLAGKYDFAEIEIFMLNYMDVSQGALPMRTGWLGEVTLKDGQFIAEVRGLSQALSQTIGSLYSPGCRAQLGDSKCGVNLASYTHSGSITAVDNAQRFSDTMRAESSGYFTHGTLTFTSGNNAGLSVEVKEFSGGQFVMSLPFPAAVQAGDAYTAIAGCDKTFGTCVGRFANAINFRGEPHVPGTDKLLETSGTFSA